MKAQTTLSEAQKKYDETIAKNGELTQADVDQANTDAEEAKKVAQKKRLQQKIQHFSKNSRRFKQRRMRQIQLQRPKSLFCSALKQMSRQSENSNRRRKMLQ